MHINHPPAGQHDEALGLIGSLDDLDARPGLLAEPPGQKIVLYLHLTDLAVEFADLGFADLVLTISAGLEHASGTIEQRLLPGMDLAGVNAELAGQFANSAVALDRGLGNLRLEGRVVLLPCLLDVLLLFLCHL